MSNKQPGSDAVLPATEHDAARLSRSDRLEERRLESVQYPHALSANLGLLNCDMMNMASGLSQSAATLLRQLEEHPDAEKKFEKRSNLFLRFVQQITRVTQTQQQLQK